MAAVTRDQIVDLMLDTLTVTRSGVRGVEAAATAIAVALEFREAS